MHWSSVCSFFDVKPSSRREVMSTLKISKHSDVPAALDLVKEEVEKEAYLFSRW